MADRPAVVTDVSRSDWKDGSKQSSVSGVKTGPRVWKTLKIAPVAERQAALVADKNNLTCIP